MHWPDDHPVRTDPRLAEWQADADAVCPQGSVLAVLRHVKGRRVATLVRTPDGPGVLKLFASPRARGNDRRLRALRPAIGSVVPRPIAVGPEGHAGLLEYVPGRPLRELAGADFVAACEEVGRVLARLHACDVLLDRTWTARSEIDNLAHRSGPGGASWLPPPPDTPVPTHRDLHAAQVVVGPDAVRLIDLDEATMAPPGLDVGNFLAHLDQDAALGSRPDHETTTAGRAFLRGYGGSPRDLTWWREIALARLAVLAEERHDRPDWAASLRALVG
jgi:aminoglycoside phosphotransferase (APT) family kinase protein